MKGKHVRARVAQVQAQAALSTCSRQKVGALLIDPVEGHVIADAYNGPYRGSPHTLCAHIDFPFGGGVVAFCEREGLSPDDVSLVVPWQAVGDERLVRVRGRLYDDCSSLEEAERVRDELLARFAPISSGTAMERGCNHAEANVISRAARTTSSTKGAWLFTSLAPCLMCAKAIHEAGIALVCVTGESTYALDGVWALIERGVAVVDDATLATWLDLDPDTSEVVDCTFAEVRKWQHLARDLQSDEF